MAATWKVGTYLVSSLSAFTTLLVGLFALPIYPIVDVARNRRDTFAALRCRGFVWSG
jgi:hypothetical protein